MEKVVLSENARKALKKVLTKELQDIVTAMAFRATDARQWRYLQGKAMAIVDVLQSIYPEKKDKDADLKAKIIKEVFAKYTGIPLEEE